MVKRLSSLVLAGLLVLPTVALADDLEDRIAALEEQQESWDLGSRIQWNGDIRTRVDLHQASTASYYKATDVATGCPADKRRRIPTRPTAESPRRGMIVSSAVGRAWESC